MFHRVRADHKKTKQKKQLVCCLMFRSSSAYEVTRDKFLLHKRRATVHSIVSKAEGWKESVSVYLIRQQDQKKKKKDVALFHSFFQLEASERSFKTMRRTWRPKHKNTFSAHRKRQEKGSLPVWTGSKTALITFTQTWILPSKTTRSGLPATGAAGVLELKALL